MFQQLFDKIIESASASVACGLCRVGATQRWRVPNARAYKWDKCWQLTRFIDDVDGVCDTRIRTTQHNTHSVGGNMPHAAYVVLLFEHHVAIVGGGWFFLRACCCRAFYAERPPRPRPIRLIVHFRSFAFDVNGMPGVLFNQAPTAQLQYGQVHTQNYNCAQDSAAAFCAQL